MKLSKLTSLVFVLGAILYSSKVDAQNVPNILESGRESRLLLVQVNSQDPKFYIKRGEARFESGDIKGAIEDFNQALRLNPNIALAYLNRGLNRRELGDENGATADLQRASELFQQQVEIAESQYVIKLFPKINNK
ncbi:MULTISPECIES: tetratricopeptide repeat protein [Nostocales]|jgi:tetratricopeptide (TPR) repeat protein|uniref:tetratricopeptide repeat protein n=1 Tax=Nostocales TaxID=1161 RepID=UPI000683F8F9|nr:MULTISPECIES: tetratricopeptide repeat protein [Nostocales]MBO1051646.1 tetratricopeptide repeat protein [Dolichospermum sp. DET73]MTJ19445.1 tetratricopeptide repeat protein [Dolichospermum sp. UHCC 0299]MTJ21469.1 tetratricopeptide repeat protein [Dolichospermum sp. UHCC 0352]MTJ40607.1 tetratricopeptide repeat protein [Dolichospermum sp. UHCC 0406]